MLAKSVTSDMRRVESDPEEQREIQNALSRAATPTHEQDTEEFDSREVIAALAVLGDTACQSLKPDGPVFHKGHGDQLPDSLTNP